MQKPERRKTSDETANNMIGLLANKCFIEYFHLFLITDVYQTGTSAYSPTQPVGVELSTLTGSSSVSGLVYQSTKIDQVDAAAAGYYNGTTVLTTNDLLGKIYDSASSSFVSKTSVIETVAVGDKKITIGTTDTPTTSLEIIPSGGGTVVTYLWKTSYDGAVIANPVGGGYYVTQPVNAQEAQDNVKLTSDVKYEYHNVYYSTLALLKAAIITDGYIDLSVTPYYKDDQNAYHATKAEFGITTGQSLPAADDGATVMIDDISVAATPKAAAPSPSMLLPLEELYV